MKVFCFCSSEEQFFLIFSFIFMMVSSFNVPRGLLSSFYLAFRTLFWSGNHILPVVSFFIMGMAHFGVLNSGC